MIVVRSTFTAKPGQAGKLITQMREVAGTGNLRNLRFLTDLTGDFNTVVMEHEVESLSELEAILQKYSSDPQMREKAKGYTELWLTGRRELYRTA